MRRVEPNAGHRAVAAIERCVVVTQNVDDLHERAGSRSPIHLHGSLFEPHCSMCGQAAGDLPEHPVESLGEGRRLPPPACHRCGAPVQINPEPTPLDEVATVNLTGPAVEILPALVDAAWPGRQGGTSMSRMSGSCGAGGRDAGGGTGALEAELGALPGGDPAVVAHAGELHSAGGSGAVGVP